MAASLPSSWVLADLFDVSSMSLDVPDHVLEAEPGLELVPCLECDGQGWVECYGSAWGASCTLWGRPDLNFMLKPCTRCHCEGEVLETVFQHPFRLDRKCRPKHNGAVARV